MRMRRRGGLSHDCARRLRDPLFGRVALAGGPGGEVAFLVEDVDAEAARLRAAGAQILAGPTDRPWGHRTLHLLDLDGFVVELAQEIEVPRLSP